MARKRSTAVRRAGSQAAQARAAAIRAEQERSERRRRNTIVVLAVVAVLALVAGIAIAVQSSRDTTGRAAVPPRHTSGYVVTVGAATAPVTVDLYEDFQCPICNELEKADRTWVQQYLDAGKVRIRYHLMAFLDGASNGHRYSSRAFNAFAAVADTAGTTVAKKMHDLLYEHQPAEGTDGLTDAQLVDLAVQAGASRSAVTPLITGETFQQWVVNATDQANKDGVTGTPTVRIGARTLPYHGVLALAAQLKREVDAAQK